MRNDPTTCYISAISDTGTSRTEIANPELVFLANLQFIAKLARSLYLISQFPGKRIQKELRVRKLSSLLFRLGKRYYR